MPTTTFLSLTEQAEIRAVFGSEEILSMPLLHVGELSCVAALTIGDLFEILRAIDWPAAKSAAKSAAKPAAKSAAKPAAKSAAKSAAKPAAKSAAKPAAKSAAKPAAKPAFDVTCSEPAATPAEGPAEHPAPYLARASEAVVAYLGSGPASRPQLVAATGDQPSAVDSALDELMARGEIRREGRARATRYVLAREEGSSPREQDDHI
jgi:hypothetical protein